MATRPVFLVASDERCCVRQDVQFTFFSGFSETQHLRSIRSLHQALADSGFQGKVLEISNKSPDALGVRLSAFNLMITTNSGRRFSVESAFQGSKVFERGGPYADLLDMPPRAAKRDERLKTSGRVVGFCLDGRQFPAEPKTFFYNWLYINALRLHPELTEPLLDYAAFTDIVFNPARSINCQAEAAAIYVSLRIRGLLEQALSSRTAFLEAVYPRRSQSAPADGQDGQMSLF